MSLAWKELPITEAENKLHIVHDIKNIQQIHVYHMSKRDTENIKQKKWRVMPSTYS